MGPLQPGSPRMTSPAPYLVRKKLRRICSGEGSIPNIYRHPRTAERQSDSRRSHIPNGQRVGSPPGGRPRGNSKPVDPRGTTVFRHRRRAVPDLRTALPPDPEHVHGQAVFSVRPCPRTRTDFASGTERSDRIDERHGLPFEYMPADRIWLPSVPGDHCASLQRVTLTTPSAPVGGALLSRN